MSRFPVDKYGRVNSRHCLGCIDEDTPALITESEAARRLQMTIEGFRSHKLVVAGSYAPERGKVVALYSRVDVDASGGQR